MPELFRAGRPPHGGFRLGSLELFALTKPSVTLYLISGPAYFIQGSSRGRIHYAAELLAGRGLDPRITELRGKSADIVRHVIGWLIDPAARQALVARLAEIKAQVGHPGSPAGRRSTS